MPASPLDSAIYRHLFGDPEVAKLFTDSAEVRAMLVVEGALAKAQGTLGMIPETAARRDPPRRDGRWCWTRPHCLPRPVAVPFRSRHLSTRFAPRCKPRITRNSCIGARPRRDIIETGLTLRLRPGVGDCRKSSGPLPPRRWEHSRNPTPETPMAGRTYGQIATPTSFGAIVASWGEPLLRHLDRLAEMRPRLLTVTLAGAAGTLSAMGSEGSKVRAAMAKALDLSDAEDSRHSSRDHIAELSSLCMLVTGSLGKDG